MTGLCMPTSIDNVSNEQRYGFHFPKIENFNDLIESRNVLLLIPNMDYVDDIQPFRIDEGCNRLLGIS